MEYFAWGNRIITAIDKLEIHFEVRSYDRSSMSLVPPQEMVLKTPIESQPPR